MFLSVLVGCEQVYCFHMTKINIMAQQENEEQLAHIFLLLISIQGLVTFKLPTYICQLFVYSFNLSFFAFAWEHRMLRNWVNSAQYDRYGETMMQNKQ